MNCAILDCTLRDGGYLVGKHFSETTVKGICSGLVDVGIDIVEMGFLQSQSDPFETVVYSNSVDGQAFLPKNRGRTLFAVLADFCRYDDALLDEYTGNSFDMVRVCFFKKERDGALEFAKRIKGKGYLVCIQPVDTFGYTDDELKSLILKVNALRPYSFSLVDTFGSIYIEELKEKFILADSCLDSGIRLGFHSHNNLQMSVALSEEAIMLAGESDRDIIVDTSLMGMGRGAGNTPTELLVRYCNKSGLSEYGFDRLLDVIDCHMDAIRYKCSWGYDIPTFLAGCYSSHVNNVSFLKEKHSISSRDLGAILRKVPEEQRKRYDYDLLEKEFLAYAGQMGNGEEAIERLTAKLNGKKTLVLVPGRKLITEMPTVSGFIEDESPIVIANGFCISGIKLDYLYFSNASRYEYWMNSASFKETKKIVTSNIGSRFDISGNIVVPFSKLLKRGWENMDNSTILLMRLLDLCGVGEIALAGFDGLSEETGARDYFDEDLERNVTGDEARKKNLEIKGMLDDFMGSKKRCRLRFITTSRFSEAFSG